MENTGVVVIPLERFEHLIATEQRVNVAVERMYHSDFFSKEDILWILGTESAVEIAQSLREEDEKRRVEYRKNNERTVAYDE